MAFLLVIGAMGLFGYSIKESFRLGEEDGEKKYKERQDHLNDWEKRFGKEARKDEEEYLRKRDEDEYELRHQEEESWKSDPCNPFGNQF